MGGCFFLFLIWGALLKNMLKSLEVTKEKRNFVGKTINFLAESYEENNDDDLCYRKFGDSTSATANQ